jgi:hypothetical protein
MSLLPLFCINSLIVAMSSNATATISRERDTLCEEPSEEHKYLGSIHDEIYAGIPSLVRYVSPMNMGLQIIGKSFILKIKFSNISKQYTASLEAGEKKVEIVTSARLPLVEKLCLETLKQWEGVWPVHTGNT